MTPDTAPPKTPDPKPSASADPKLDASVAKPEIKDATKADAKPTAIASKPTTKPDAKANPKTGAKPEAQPAPQDDLKTLPMVEVEKNWNRRRTVSPMLKRRNGSRNMVQTNSLKRRRISC